MSGQSGQLDLETGTPTSLKCTYCISARTLHKDIFGKRLRPLSYNHTCIFMYITALGRVSDFLPPDNCTFLTHSYIPLHFFFLILYSHTQLDIASLYLHTIPMASKFSFFVLCIHTLLYAGRSGVVLFSLLFILISRFLSFTSFIFYLVGLS